MPARPGCVEILGRRSAAGSPAAAEGPAEKMDGVIGRKDERVGRRGVMVVNVLADVSGLVGCGENESREVYRLLEMDADWLRVAAALGRLLRALKPRGHRKHSIVGLRRTYLVFTASSAARYRGHCRRQKPKDPCRWTRASGPNSACLKIFLARHYHDQIL